MTLLELRNKIWHLLPYSDIPTDYDLQAIMDLVAEYGDELYRQGYLAGLGISGDNDWIAP